MPLLDDCVTLLEAANVAQLNVNLFLRNATVPILPSGSVNITDYPGEAPIRTQNSVVLPGYIQPRAQFMIRAKNADLAYQLARSCYNAVCGIRNVFINSGWYREINPLQEPAPAGEDGNRQYRVVFNIKAVKRPEVVS